MSIFKACDIRGIYPEDINQDIIYKIGVVLGKRLIDKKAVVAGDIRNSTPELKEALIKGLLTDNLQLIDIGTLPTPTFYFAKDELAAEGGMIVTASHNPPQYNGLKLMLGSMPVTEEEILAIEQETRQVNTGETIKQGEYIQDNSIEEKYRNFLHRLLPGKHQGEFKVVIDAGNGAYSRLAPRLFKEKGYRVVELFCEFDGNFPNRSPNPAVKENLVRLQEVVLAEKANLGIGFDGDGDRVIFVDEKGRIIDSDRSFVILIKHIIKPGEGVVFDLKCSSIVPEVIREYGGIPLMEKSGHAFIKKTLLEKNARLGGEISGHFFFQELGRDDGLYAALLMADIISGDKKPLSSLINELPEYLSTPDLRITYRGNRKELLQRVEKGFDEEQITRIDGIRVEFPEGWGLIRKSITEPCVTLRFEAKDRKGLEKIIDAFLALLPEIKEDCLKRINQTLK
jgi:phosphomannomutase / phosphoglucomutase